MTLVPQSKMARAYEARIRETLERVFLERTRQLAKWGDQRHGTGTWRLILGEEIGEADHEALRLRFDALTDYQRAAVEDLLIAELIQAAAVIVAWIEQLVMEQSGSPYGTGSVEHNGSAEKPENGDEA